MARKSLDQCVATVGFSGSSPRTTGSLGARVVAVVGLGALVCLGLPLTYPSEPVVGADGQGVHLTEQVVATADVPDVGVSTSGVRPAQQVSAQLIVKYRDSVVEPVDRLLARGASFRSATTDTSDSLDRLNAKFGVRSARPVFAKLLESLKIPREAKQSTVKHLLAERLEAVRRRYPQRAARATSPNLSDLSHVYVVDLAPGTDVTNAAREFGADPHVDYAQPNYVVTTQSMPNDPYYQSSGSWGQAYQDLWGLWKIQAGSAWDITQGDGIVVAVVDTGLDMSHPDIATNVWSNPAEVLNGLDDDGNGYVDDVHGWDFASNDNDPADGHGHGTHVSGTIAAVGNNGLGVIGVAPQAKVMPVKGLDDGGSGDLADLAAAIIYAAQNGADVINNSWGCGVCPSNPVAEDAVRLAHGLGAVVVFAAGNDSLDVANVSPQNLPESITVSAATNIDNLAFFSNFGAGVDVAAPGAGEDAAPSADMPWRAILSLQSGNCHPDMCPANLLMGNGYLRQAGTSMAAPHVAGLAALVLSAHPTFTVEQVRQAIRRSCDDIGAPGVDDRFGYGRINASRALSETEPLEALITSPTSTTVVTGIDPVEVQGVAAGPGFSSYRLEVGSGTLPTTWTTVATSTAPVSPAGRLATWDHSVLADGAYTLRVWAINAQGQTYADRQSVTIDHVQLTAPPPGRREVFRAGEVVTISGTVVLSNLSSYRIIVSNHDGTPLSNPDITLTDGGLHSISNGVLATWDTTGVPADYYTITLEVTLTDGSVIREDTEVCVDPTLHPGWPIRLGVGHHKRHLNVADVNLDGSADLLIGDTMVRILDHTGANLSGWPQSVEIVETNTFVNGSPVIGDLTGDGVPEIVATGTEQYQGYGWIFVWSSSGELLPGWPAIAGPNASTSIADVDGDGTNEIVATDWDGAVRVLNASGTLLPGWPQVLDFGVNGMATTTPVVGDLDGDGRQEIAVMGFGEPNYLYVLASDGTILWRRAITPVPTLVPGEHQPSSPAMAQLDDDPFREIVACGKDGLVYVLNHDGTDVPGWPQMTTTPEIPDPLFQGWNSPAVADLDGDGRSEIIVGGEATPDGIRWFNLLFAWHRDGTVVTGWPVVYEILHETQRDLLDFGNAGGFSAAAVADLGGDGRADITASRNGRYALTAYDPDGVELPGFPKPTAFRGSDEANTPAVADLDGDGLLEMAWIDANENLYVWDLEGPRSGAQPWPMFHHDAQNTGAPGVPILRYDSYTGLTEIDGNGNAVVEPGETWDMSVRLRNDGTAPVLGVSADLSVDPSTPGAVFLLQDSSVYATIDPAQVVSSLGTYRFRVGDDFPCGGEVVLSVTGITSTDPAGSHADEVGVIRIPVGNSAESVTLYYDNFEPRTIGPFWEADGEWENDRPRGFGGPQADPQTAYEGEYVLGTDLTGLGPNPGNYENDVASSVYSPFFATVPGIVPTEIRFAHWINLAQGDYVTMHVYSDVPEDDRYFTWPGRSESSWTVETFDISGMAGGKNWLRVEFLLQSDGQGTSSGWNMDAFEVRGLTCEAFDRALPGDASNLLVGQGAPGELTLEWSADCGAATTYGIYRGDLRVGYESIVAEPGACDVTGTSATIPLGSGDAEFFLVVPHKDGEEGGYGTDSSGASRSPAAGGCYPQGAVVVCAP